MSDISKLFGEYLDHLEIEKNRSIKTIENYRRYLEYFFTWSKVSSPGDITEEMVRKFRIHLNREAGAHDHSLKKNTQNYYVIALRSFLAYCAKRDVKSLSPEKVELARQPSREIEFLTDDEMERLLASADGASMRLLRDKAILLLLFSAGLRVSEMCALNRDQHGLEKGEFSVRGKGDKIRVVFLSDEAAAALKAYLLKRTDMNTALFVRVPKTKNVEAYYARERNNLRLTPRSIQRIIRYYATKAGIANKKVTPHSLRHYFATDLLKSGADLRSVQEMLGHTNIATTQIYTHFTNQELKKIHDKFHHRKKGQ